MTELLSPAGNIESLYAAYAAGADAVYAGADRFSARAYAGNFTIEEFSEAIDYAHLIGKKLYMTLNILMKPSEMEGLEDFLVPLYLKGLDGVIVQDIGVIGFIKEKFPKLSVHVSTQCSLCTPYGAKLMKSIGADRIVTARELSLQEIREIKNNCDIEIESFIHGAMCYSYSGLCLMSSMMGGRSGNRGRCAGSCRQPYKDRNKEAYYLSMKDLCSINVLPAIIEAGVCSLKIEGRMKAPEYVYAVTGLYRKYLDLYESKKEYRVEKRDLERLTGVYSRSGLNEGYYKKRNGKEMITFEKGAYHTDTDKVVIAPPPSVKITGKAGFIPGEKARLELSAGNITVCEYAGEVETAKSAPMKEEDIRKHLEKTGDGGISFRELSIAVGENVFIPVKALKELRRRAVGRLKEEILNDFKRTL
ncbi:MAG: U32 family peptidase [Lachnospiraceae bacterium]|nr:U32 family peptidase [Lachnospiraceae bacterium]